MLKTKKVFRPANEAKARSEFAQFLRVDGFFPRQAVSHGLAYSCHALRIKNYNPIMVCAGSNYNFVVGFLEGKSFRRHGGRRRSKTHENAIISRNEREQFLTLS